MPTFRDCVLDQLTQKGFGKARRDQLIGRYDGLVKGFTADGHPLPEGAAASKMLKELDFETRETKRVAFSNLRKFAEIGRRFDTFNMNKAVIGTGRSDSRDMSIVVRGMIEGDPRSGALAVQSHVQATRSQLYSLLGEGINEVTKGAFGRQRGRSTLRNVLPELDGKSTGDAAAREIAAGWKRMTEAIPNLWRRAGGAMNQIEGTYLPEPESAVKLVRAGRDAYVNDALNRLDWKRTRWPDGSPIDPADRTRFLEEVWRTKKSGGASKFNRAGFRHSNPGFGNLLKQHRLLHYKDAASWGEMFEKYGDGNLFEMMVNYVDDMAHKIGTIKVFGSSPETMYQSARRRAIARAEALDQQQTGPRRGQTAQSITEAGLKNVVDPMMEVTLRQNPMDPESVLGNVVVATSNVLTSAFLGSATLLAIPGDFATTIASKLANGYTHRSFGGMGYYMQALLTSPGEAQRIAQRTGFVMDETLSTMYAQQRYSGMATNGPMLSRRVADVVLRASLLTPHTKAARYSFRMETMATLHDLKDVVFADHPMRAVFERYGITPADWDAFRQIAPYQPRPGVNMLAPVDLLDGTKAGEALFDKFQGMIWQETRTAVITATTEGAVRLTNATRPDTLLGAIGHSFALYKSFPVSLVMLYARLAMSLDSGRLGLLAGTAAAMTMVGALGTQMREISNGRDPMPMDSPEFWGKAILTGGALSVFGDFLFAGVNQYGKGPQDVVAGPPILFAGDLAQLTLGDGFEWLAYMSNLSEERPDKSFGFELTEMAARYTPGTSLWYTKLAAQRELFDRLKMLADPRAAMRQNRRRRQFRQREFGQDYFSPPGSSITEMRAPEFGGIFDADG